MTVADFLTETFLDLDYDADDFLKKIPLDSAVGQDAKAAIVAGKAFALTLDPHRTVQVLVADAIVAHINILYHG